MGYVGTPICLRKDNGDIVWNAGDGYTNQVYTTLVVLPSGKVVYATNNGWLKIRDADNGDLIWSHYLYGYCYSSAVAVVDNYILISSDSGDLWCFGPGNVEPNKPENLLVSNLDSPVPSFSAIFTDNDLGDYTASAKIQVGTSEGDNDVWTSDWITIGKIDNNQRSSYVSWFEVASGATYYAQMKFKDDAGNESPWSDSVTFTQTNPYADNLLAEGKVSPQDVATFSPEFSFRYTDNFGDNSSMFRIQVASMWDNQQSVNVENGTTISITYAGTTLQRGVQYFWRVKIRDNTDSWSDWSSSENFMICLLNLPDNLRVENQISPQRLTTMTPNFSFCYTDNAGENSGTARVQVWKGGGGLSASENIYPSEDAYTDSENPDSNYGNENHLDVYCYEGTEPYKYAFLKFDLEGIPTWATINSATLRWYVQNTDYLWAYGYVGPVEDDSWTENTITWNSQPSISEGGALSEFDFEYSGWHSFDSTSYVLEQAAGDGVASIGIVNYYNVPVEESMVIASRENPDYAPYLEVSYEHYLWDNTQNKNVENNSIITATYAGENLQRGNTYFWRARVQDNMGAWSDWSDNENFRINQLPTVENLKTEGQVNPTGLATFTPAFSWNYSDNDNDAQSNYQIQVGVSENDNSMWNNTGTTPTQITYSGNALSRSVTYYVRVRVKDNYEWSTWANGTFKLSQSPTVTVGDSTIELKLVDAGDAPVITTSTFTIKLTVGTRTENLLIYYAFVEETPSIQTDGAVAPFYFSISTTNSGAITSATITFNIPKSWVQTNDIVLSTLTVWRNTDGTWQTLPTALVGEDVTYYYLEATTTGFSLFCVTGQKKAVAPSETPMAAPTPQTSPSDQQMQQVVFIAALGILIVVVMLLASSYMRHKKRK
jgi:PGF-pre-PGF domain-containing protein